MNKPILIVAPLCIIIGFAGGYWLAQSKQAKGSVAISTNKPEILFYRNPMNPEVTSPTPTQDSMGMAYIPVYATKNKTLTGTVEIDGVTVQNIGVRTATAKQSTLSHIVRAVGRVAFDEESMVHLHPKTEGWIEQQNVDKTGQWVKKNADLLSI